jgi:hypothetical protein
MTAIAAARAGDAGLRNVRTRVLDVESIDEPDESYDVVLCREGLMFATDPPPRHARSTACSGPEAASPWRCGGRRSATRGSAWSSRPWAR